MHPPGLRAPSITSTPTTRRPLEHPSLEWSADFPGGQEVPHDETSNAKGDVREEAGTWEACLPGLAYPLRRGLPAVPDPSNGGSSAKAFRGVVAGWLASLPWDHWFTLTYDDDKGGLPRSDDAALAHVARWLSRADRRFSRSRNVYGMPVAVYFLEGLGEGTLRQPRLHVHGLITGMVGRSACRALWSTWFRDHGRAQVVAVRDRRATATYAAKYVTKAGATRWGVFPVGAGFHDSELSARLAWRTGGGWDACRRFGRLTHDTD